MNYKGFRLMEEAQGGEEGAAAGAEAGAEEAGATEEAAAATPAVPTALEQGQAAQPIPEKYQVKKEDGTLDAEASYRKLAEGYGALEKRVGSGDIPPKTADEYTVTVPDALKDIWKPEGDVLFQEFKNKAHAAGYTQPQLDLALKAYWDVVPNLLAGNKQLTVDDCTAELKQEWKTDEQYKAEVGKAYKAAIGYGDKDAEGIVRDYGNDPRIIRMLAKIGGEMGEDTSLSAQVLPQGQSVEALMSSEAYRDAKHLDHASVSKQVQEYFKAKAKADEKAGNAPLM